MITFQQSKRQATDFIVRKQRKGGVPNFKLCYGTRKLIYKKKQHKCKNWRLKTRNYAIPCVFL